MPSEAGGFSESRGKLRYFRFQLGIIRLSFPPEPKTKRKEWAWGSGLVIGTFGQTVLTIGLVAGFISLRVGGRVTAMHNPLSK